MPYDSYISRGDTPEHSAEPGAHPLIPEAVLHHIIKWVRGKPAAPKAPKGSRRT
jgi:hypothetical protein